MNYIPQLEKVTVGDTVVTSGLSEDIPRGLVIGRVTNVKSISNEVWQTATIEPLLNFKNLTVVSVVIP
jgi:rod shape-determining protein MreC